MKKTARLLKIILILNICLISLNFTYSYFLEETNKVDNTFSPTVISSYQINETFDGSLKKDVNITNLGNVPSYIRVALTINIIDDNDNVIADIPIEGKDYDLEINEEWIKKDNLYYYPRILQKGETTDNVIKSLKSLNDDLKLRATVLVQGISAYDLDRSKDLIHIYD